MTIHPLELYPWAVVIKDIIDDESMNNAIAWYIEKKYQEYSNNLGIDDLLSTSITQQYRVKKDQERKKYEAEKQRNIILEKEKTLKPMEFAPAKLINCSSLSAEILLKHHINLDTGRAIDDVYGMARVDWETLRKIWYDKNSSNAYGKWIYSYAERWAKLMQTEIEQWSKLTDIADRLSYDADIEWITWFMYWATVSVLSQCWKYWEELRMRHNKKYNHEWIWVVNPAVITISSS